jgi:hypothetical protein
MNIIFAEKDIQQRIEETKNKLEKCHEQYLKGEISALQHHQQERELLNALEKLFIMKNTQGITY